MTQRTELWVDRQNYRKTQIVRDEIPALAEGEVLVAIDKFGLTTNNVSYAVSGDMIGYWSFYPTEAPWGKVPVWGCASVVASKTGFGLAHMLHNDPQVNVNVVGITSTGNVDFVQAMDCCDDIIIYGDEAQIDASIPSAYVDMSGDIRLTTALHNHLGDNIVESAMVGASHWEAGGKVGKREKEWGPGVVMFKAMVASAEVAKAVQGDMSVEWTRGAEDLARLWLLAATRLLKGSIISNMPHSIKPLPTQ